MTFTMSSSDLNKSLEAFLGPSVVLIAVDDEPVATGFFVSDRGDICSCRHTLPPCSAKLGIYWAGDLYPAEYLPTGDPATQDYALLQVSLSALGERKTIPVPVLERELNESDQYDPIVVLGFAGLQDPYAPRRMRLFEGKLLQIEEYSNPTTGRKNLQIETADVTVGKGNSGAPLFDLRLFRVIGYVQGRLEEKPSGFPERLGRACTLAELLRQRSDLRDTWAASGVRADKVKRSFFGNIGIPIPFDMLTWQDLQAAATLHNERAISELVRKSTYDETLFVPRTLTAELDFFVDKSDFPVAIVSGFSGSGKTNLLIDFLRRRRAANTLAVFLSGETLNPEKPLDHLCSILGIEQNLNRLFQFLARIPFHGVLLILDGFNEGPGKSRGAFKKLLEQIHDAPAGLNLKVIVSIRTEFIQEQLSELIKQQSGPPSDLPLDMLFQHTETDPVTGEERSTRVSELPLLTSGETSEQAVLYEHYRECGSIINAAGKRIGIRPKTPYRDLPEHVRRCLDRPLLLKVFMMHYDGREVTDLPVDWSLLAEIAAPEISRWVPSSSERARTDIFLGRFADLLLQLDAWKCPLSRISQETWGNLDLVTQLLERTFLLVQTPSEGGLDIAFGSDWFFDHYLMVFLREQCLMEKNGEGRFRVLNESILRARAGQANDHLVAALTYLGVWALGHNREIFVAFLQAASVADSSPSRDAFMKAFFEYTRVHLGWRVQQPAQKNTAGFLAALAESRQHLAIPGLRRVLTYLEQLGNEGTKDALFLLTQDERLWERLDAEGRANFFSIRALKRFEIYLIVPALEDLQQIGTDVPESVRARYDFVMGRCLQYKREYDEALKFFKRSQNAPGYYGSMCRHQIGFIRFFQQSDYRGAAEMLRSGDPDGAGKWDNSSSKMLYITCLIELARYAEALPMLEEEIELRRKLRQHLGHGRALRTMAELYFRQFETEQTKATIELAGEETKDHAHFLTYAGILEKRAMFAGVLEGDLGAAFQAVNESLDLSRKGQHQPSISWALQTRALLHALAGDPGSAERDLKVLREENLGCNPNQERRTRLIRILAATSDRSMPRGKLIEDSTSLKQDYERVGNGWYPGVLSLVIGAMKGEVPRDSRSAAAHFREPVNAEELVQSYLFRTFCGINNFVRRTL